ncbi:MAG: hypothetical protein IJZ32_03810 [Clostridia bacterium]|nr:hypothetical protein [Clostridia bacterium]
MNILRSIWYSFLYETSRRLIFLLALWCGVLVADIYFNRMLELGFLYVLATIIAIAVGVVYYVSYKVLTKCRGNARIRWFNVNGKNYYVSDQVSSIGGGGKSELFLMIVYSLVAVPIYLFKVVWRIILSLFSKKYRQSIEEYYENESYEMYNNLKWGGIFSGAYAVIIALMFGIIGIQGLVYSPKKIVIENAEINYYSNSLGDGYYLQFDYYTTFNKVVALYAPFDEDETVLYIEDTNGNVVYELKFQNLILDTRNSQTTETIYFGEDFSKEYLRDGYKTYLVFAELEAKSFLTTSRMDIDYVVRVL